jgi:hypothetical protein
VDQDPDLGTIVENEQIVEIGIGKENVSVRGVQDVAPEALAGTREARIALAGNAGK